MSTVLEIVMVSRKKHLMAAVTYACSDIVRTLFFIVPAFALRQPARRLRRRGRVRRASTGAAARSLWREFGREFRVDVGAVARAARLRAAVRAGGGRRGHAAQLPPVRRRVAVRRGDVRDLRRRLPADSAGRYDHDVDRQRDDGQDGRGRERTATTTRGAVARDDLPPGVPDGPALACSCSSSPAT